MAEKCLLCEKTNKNFTCRSCLREGNFYITNTNACNTKKKDNLKFSCKEKKFRITCAVSKEYQKRIETKILENEKYLVKKKKLIMLKDRIETLKLLLNETKNKNIKERIENEKLNEKYSRRDIISEKLRLSRAKLIDEKLMVDQKNLLNERMQDKLMYKRKHLKDMQVSHVNALIKHIFPLSSCMVYADGLQVAYADDIVSEVISAAEMELEDATRIIHVDGEWVSQDTIEEVRETEYTVVDVGMPTLKDFIKYYEWLKSYRSEPRKHESSTGLHGNAVLKIPASLVYTTQLTAGLSFYLDICLPNHVEYYDFSLFRLSRKRLNETINQLSHNIMHLCFSQKISIFQLDPNDMLRNLKLLVSTDNLGRWGCYETADFKLSESLFDSDSSAEEINDSDCDDMLEGDPEEWDKVDIPPDSELQMNNPSMPSVNAYSSVQSQQSQQSHQSRQSQQQTLSLAASSASGIVSSAAASVISGLWSWKR